MTEKKEFIKAEVEVIRFEKNDVIATSDGKTQTIGPIGIEPITETCIDV